MEKLKEAMQTLVFSVFYALSEWLTRVFVRSNDVRLYSPYIVRRMRNVYYCGLPASLTLLSTRLRDCHETEIAEVLARVLATEPDGDVRVLHASIRSLRLNPVFREFGDCDCTQRCLIEWAFDKECWIIDTTRGLMFRKWVYCLIEAPKVSTMVTKTVIAEQKPEMDEYRPRTLDEAAPVLRVVIPAVEACLADPEEMYAWPGIRMLQLELLTYEKRAGIRSFPEGLGVNEAAVRDNKLWRAIKNHF